MDCSWWWRRRSSLPAYLRNHNHGAVPIVYLDRLYRGLRGDGVMADNVGGSFDAVCHLLGLGHRRVAIITGPPQLQNARMRLEGYKRALAHFKLEVDDELIREGRFDVDSGYEQAKAILSLN